LRLQYDEPASTVAFNFNLRRYIMAEFGDGLLGFFYTTHILAPGEAVGKSSNTAWARAHTPPLFGST
jgi:hypothetical protein